MLDKTLKALKTKRTEATVALTLSHSYFGNGTAATRSLSHAESKDCSWFDWPRFSHPSLVGTKACIQEIESFLKNTNANDCFGFFYKTLGEKSGLTLPAEFVAYLESLRQKTGIPLIACDSAASHFRSGKSFFLSDSLDSKPNVVLWYTGAQQGQAFFDDETFIDTPLALISTWDGDEISMARNRKHIEAAFSKDIPAQANDFEVALATLDLPYKRHGMGLWQAIYLESDEKVIKALSNAKAKGLILKKGFESSVILCPPLLVTPKEIKQGLSILQEALS